MNLAARIFRGLQNAGAIVAGCMFVSMMILVCLDVVMRYLVKNPFGWVVEVCEYQLLYVTFLGAPWLLRHDGHVRVDVIYHFLWDRAKDRLQLATNILGGLACLALFVFGCISTWDALVRGTPVINTLNVPKWILLWVIPYGSLMLFIEFCRKIYEYFIRKSPSEEPEAAGEVE